MLSGAAGNTKRELTQPLQKNMVQTKKCPFLQSRVSCSTYILMCATTFQADLYTLGTNNTVVSEEREGNHYKTR